MSVSCQLFQSGRIAENFNENLCVRVVSDYNSVQGDGGDGVRLETRRLADTSSIIQSPLKCNLRPQRKKKEAGWDMVADKRP